MMKPGASVYTLQCDEDTIRGWESSIPNIPISMEHSEADMDKKSDRKLVSFRLPEDLMQELRVKADEENTSVTELVCRFLRQGLQTSVDDRIAALEAEIRDLRREKQPSFGNFSPASIYTLMPQNLVPYDNDNETKRRLEKLEELVEKLADTVVAQSQTKPSQEDSHDEAVA